MFNIFHYFYDSVPKKEDIHSPYVYNISYYVYNLKLKNKTFHSRTKLTKMARPKQDKTRVNISINTQLNDIFNKKNINKSALIESLPYKYLTSAQNKTQVSSHTTQDPKTMRTLGLEPRTPRSSVWCSTN